MEKVGPGLRVPMTLMPGGGHKWKKAQELCWLPCLSPPHPTPPPPAPVLQPLLCLSDYFLLGPKLDDFHRGPNGVVKLCTFPTGVLEFQMSKEGKWHADE